MANLVQNPYPIITDSNGDPLEDGYVFIGEPGLSPITNPLQAYWDADLTVPAVNIRTKGGYFSNGSLPGRIYTATNYSILVQDRNKVTVYTQLDSVDYINSASGSNISSVETIADLRGILPVESNVQVSVGGSATEGDGLMGPLYYWNASSSATDNGVSIIEPTASVGNGRWLWINTNAPMESVNISASGTLTLNFINRIFLVDTALAITLVVPDGDFQGQDIQVANVGSSTLQITGTGIPANTFVVEQVLLTWVGTEWSITYKTVDIYTDNIYERTPGEGVSIQAEGSVQLKTKIIAIGDWDMNATASVNITHNLSTHTAVREVTAMIRQDTDSIYMPLSRIQTSSGVSDGAITAISSTIIQLSRVAGGTFQSTSYESTSFNRGWIKVLYEV